MTHRSYGKLTSRRKRDTNYFLKWCEGHKLNYILWGIVIVLIGVLWTTWSVNRDIGINNSLTDQKYECQMDKIYYDRLLKEVENPKLHR